MSPENESTSFFSLLKSFSAPLLSVALMMLSGGFFVTFISIYLDTHGASKFQIGLVQSAYYAGMLFGSFKMEKFVRKIGHVQSLCAFGALATATIMLQMLYPNLYVWILLRFISGICLAAIYIVIESWMLVSNGSMKSRGIILSAYMISLYASQAASQQILKCLDIQGHYPFVISALFASLAIIPISLSTPKIPLAKEEEALSFIQIGKTSLFGSFSCVASGLILSALYSFFPLYAERRGVSAQNMMSLMIIGGVLFQWPFGKLSDLFNRKKVLLSIIGTSLTTMIAGFAYLGLNPLVLYSFAFLIGGFSFTLYPVAMTCLCEKLSPAQITKATALLLIAYGIGAAIGPIICSFFVSVFGMAAIFFYLSIVLISIGLIGLISLYKEKAVPENLSE